MPKIRDMLPQTGRVFDESGDFRNVIERGLPVIDIIHEAIHRKEYFDVQKVYTGVANASKVRFNIVATTKDLHLVFTTDAEGKSRFRSYIGTTFSAPGTELPEFNRYIDEAPDPTGQVFENPTVTLLGTQRFDKLILGGLGPQSTGQSSGSRVETILAAGNSVYVEIENVSGQSKDIGITVEWYEV